jgi:hypothetical protein
MQDCSIRRNKFGYRATKALLYTMRVARCDGGGLVGVAVDLLRRGADRDWHVEVCCGGGESRRTVGMKPI